MTDSLVPVETRKRGGGRRSPCKNASVYIGVVLCSGILIGASSGCGSKTEQAAAKVNAASFKADPSKMTEEDKKNMQKLMKAGGNRPAGTPSTATQPKP